MYSQIKIIIGYNLITKQMVRKNFKSKQNFPMLYQLIQLKND